MARAYFALASSVKEQRWRNPKHTAEADTAPQGACCCPAMPPMKVVASPEQVFVTKFVCFPHNLQDAWPSVETTVHKF